MVGVALLEKYQDKLFVRVCLFQRWTKKHDDDVYQNGVKQQENLTVSSWPTIFYNMDQKRQTSYENGKNSRLTDQR